MIDRNPRDERGTGQEWDAESQPPAPALHRPRFFPIAGHHLVILLFIALGAIYSIKTPAFETPDEIWHFAFIHHLAQGQGLPVSEPGTTALWQQQGVQPPGYYLAAAALTAWVDTGDFPAIFARTNPHRAIGAPDAPINRNYLLPYADDGYPWSGTFLALHLARLFSVLLGAVTLWASYQGLCLILPSRVALFGVASFAFIPQFIFISAAVSNDNAVNALAALVLWRVLALAMTSPTAPDSAPPRREFLILGVLLGLAALTKLSALGLIGVAGLAVLVYSAERRDWRSIVQAAVWIGGPLLLIAGWWYFRNWFLYADLLAWNIWQANILLRVEPAGLSVILGELGGLERSFWGLFGWMNVAYPDMVYSFFRSLTGLVGIGLIWGVVRKLRSGDNRVPAFDRRYWAGALLMLWLLVLLVSWLRFMQIAPAAQGRYFHPAAPTLAMLLGLGLAGWRLWTLPWLATGTLLLLSALTPWWIIAPAYIPPPSQDAVALTPVEAGVGTAFAIRGIHSTPARLTPGDTATVTVEWEMREEAAQDGRDYSVFVHLVDVERLVIAQLDTMPGGGLLPTSQWTPGTRYTESYRVRIPPAAYTPNRATWAIGLYGGDYRPHVGPIDGPRLPVQLAPSINGEATVAQATISQATVADNALLFDSALDSVEIAPPPGEIPNALHARFAGDMWLEGYRLSGRVLTPGDVLDVTLYWRSATTPDREYTVFVHLLNETLDGVGGEDRGPVEPTTSWQPGEIYAHIHPITIPADLPPGSYRLAVGMYSRPGFDRLALVDPGRARGVDVQAEGADRYILGPLRVENQSTLPRAPE